jgi:hypothetical protein
MLLSFKEFLTEKSNNYYSYNDDYELEEAASAGEAIEGLTGAILLYYRKSKIPDKLPFEVKQKNFDAFKIKEVKEIIELLKSQTDTMLYQKGDSDELLKKESSLIAAFSAAKTIEEYLKEKYKNKNFINIWRTGRTWPTRLREFGLDKIGGKDYNSSDLVIEYSENKFLGISLKIKPNELSADPTAINQSFSKILTKDVKDDLQNTMLEFFEQETKEIIDYLKTILPESNKINNFKYFFTEKGKKIIFPIDYKKEFEDKFSNKKDELNKFFKKPDKDGNYYIISLIRVLINKALSNKKNVFYDKLFKVFEDENIKTSFLETIYDAMFKAKIAAEDFNKKGFDFDLILLTGYNTTDEKIKIGHIVEYKTIFDILNKINKSELNIKFLNTELDDNIEDVDKIEDSTSSIKAGLFLGDNQLADIQIRFKGNFSSLSGLSVLGTISKFLKDKIKETKI